MPEPQSTEFFLILVAVFGALVWWVIVAKQLVFRILAACLAFIPAMAFGVAAVNKYYDYYQTWHAAISDLTNQGVQTANAPNVPAGQDPEYELLSDDHPPDQGTENRDQDQEEFRALRLRQSTLRSGGCAPGTGRHWRWRWDLNPRKGCPFTRFRGVRPRPLGDSTADEPT